MQTLTQRGKGIGSEKLYRRDLFLSDLSGCKPAAGPLAKCSAFKTRSKRFINRPEQRGGRETNDNKRNGQNPKCRLPVHCAKVRLSILLVIKIIPMTAAPGCSHNICSVLRGNWIQ